MEAYKIKANEEFFKNMHNLLKNGGVYIFPDAKQVYIKENDVYKTSQDGMDAVSPLVSKEFFDKYFKLQENA